MATKIFIVLFERTLKIIYKSLLQIFHLSYEYRDLRAVEWSNKVSILLHKMFFTSKICRVSVLIDRTIFFTIVEIYRISVLIG